ncbi:MAG: class I SAM-dependent methyltransferase [Desulfomonile sp.]|nr:class I SAM-dependent methyltransferase [Desulfomonile sp.]
MARSCVSYVHGDVLEVGAGIGSNTPFFYHSGLRSWTCLEPDTALAKTLCNNLARRGLEDRISVLTCQLQMLPSELLFDTIVYVDVLEHIQDDAAELLNAADHLRALGSLIVVAPAHTWLYCEFDKSCGHYRRYNKETLRRAAPERLKERRLLYLDSAGMAASLMNCLWLHHDAPSPAQIRIWDRTLVPISCFLDLLVRYRLGKTVMGVWIKPTD